MLVYLLLGAVFFVDSVKSLGASRNRVDDNSAPDSLDLNTPIVGNGNVNQSDSSGSILRFPGKPKEKRRETSRLDVERRQLVRLLMLGYH